MEIKEGELIALIDLGKKRRVHLARALPEIQYVKGVGRIAPGDLVGRDYGSSVKFSGRDLLAMRPSLKDYVGTFRRGTQIITPKDSWAILFLVGIEAGYRVIEIGAGSGGMTLALANAIGDEGRVYSYDRKELNLAIAAENLSKTPFMDRIDFRVGDCSHSVDEKNVDAVVVDIPEPWTVVETSLEALKVCGSFASYVPTFNQLAPLVGAMKDGFGLIETCEILERSISVKEGAIRPKDFFPHTGYITRGRKLA